MATLLARKNSLPMARDDGHHELMASDPSIQEFPQGSSFGTVNANFASSTVNNVEMQPAWGSTQNINQSWSNQPVRTGAAPENAASNAEVLVSHDQSSSDWINKKWRPAMGWMYMGVCIFDFILFPILYAVVQFWETNPANDAFRQWEPLTLQGAGLFHMAMGAVLGIAAYGRTKEKVEGKA